MSKKSLQALSEYLKKFNREQMASEQALKEYVVRSQADTKLFEIDLKISNVERKMVETGELTEEEAFESEAVRAKQRKNQQSVTEQFYEKIFKKMEPKN